MARYGCARATLAHHVSLITLACLFYGLYRHPVLSVALMQHLSILSISPLDMSQLYRNLLHSHLLLLCTQSLTF